MISLVLTVLAMIVMHEKNKGERRSYQLQHKLTVTYYILLSLYLKASRVY